MHTWHESCRCRGMLQLSAMQFTIRMGRAADWCPCECTFASSKSLVQFCRSDLDTVSDMAYALPSQDKAAALLGEQVKSDFLLLLTDAPAVYDPRGWPAKKEPVPSPITPAALRSLGDFAAGSMGPKVGYQTSAYTDASGTSIFPHSAFEFKMLMAGPEAGPMWPQGKGLQSHLKGALCQSNFNSAGASMRTEEDVQNAAASDRIF
jgi:hypothetical protein